VWTGRQLCPPLVAVALASLQLLDPARPGLEARQDPAAAGTDVPNNVSAFGIGWLPSSFARIYAVELKVVADGVLIRSVQPRLSLAERLAIYTPMAGEATEAMAWDPMGTELNE